MNVVYLSQYVSILKRSVIICMSSLDESSNIQKHSSHRSHHHRHHHSRFFLFSTKQHIHVHHCHIIATVIIVKYQNFVIQYCDHPKMCGLFGCIPPSNFHQSPPESHLRHDEFLCDPVLIAGLLAVPTKTIQ